MAEKAPQSEIVLYLTTTVFAPFSRSDTAWDRRGARNFANGRPRGSASTW